MKYSEIKAVAYHTGRHDWRDVVEQMADGVEDIDAGNFRFIAMDAIDEIQLEELKGDLYVLGCFNADFLAGVTGIPERAIVALQKAEEFETLGEMLVDHIDDIQGGYAAADGYGHHFAHYDHETHEIGDYYGFRVN